MKDLTKLKSSMQIVLSFIAIIIISLIIFLLIVSPGKPAAILDQKSEHVKGSISEKVFVKIGGVQQGMFIRSRDLNNPVLLFVHGGPSFSEYFLVDKYPTGIENYFTVCYWEERGGGLSYSPEVTSESMTMDQLASDAIEVTNYLRERFKKEKIYLMAHSGGTAFAVEAAASHPELFYAYVGISQITRQSESEKLAYRFMLDRYTVLDNKKMLKEFQKYQILDNDSLVLPFFNSVTRDKSMHELGIGTMRSMRSILTGVFIPVWTCRAYTIKEKYNIWKSKFTFINKTTLRKQIISSDVTAKVPKLDIPVYFMSGNYDLTVNRNLSKEYFSELESPLKGFYTFYNSAHSPMFEEPDRFIEILTRDVLNHSISLADK
jgi:pimeloyl-ACP methyl ester carboxylesterase